MDNIYVFVFKTFFSPSYSSEPHSLASMNKTKQDPGWIKDPAVSSSKGVQRNMKSTKAILKQLSIIPTASKGLSSLIVAIL